MDFIIKVVLSFIVGGSYVAGVIWLSEKLGSRIGGAIAGLPSTILISMIFINITQGPADVREAVAIVPLMFMATLLYAIVFLKVEANTKRHPVAIITATIAWTSVALVFKLFSKLDFIYIVAIGVAGLVGFKIAFHKFDTTAPKKIKLPKNIYLIRFIIGGSVIASSVLIAKLLGPVWGGVVGSMPAMLGCILYFLSKSQGSEFLHGFLRRLPLSYISSLLFLVVIHQSLTNINSVLAFTLGMSGASIYTFSIIYFKRKIKT